ncbi:MAG: type II toxin-antitoxin system HicB family antitoxin [Lachnospiraceae bacterium]|nr:type II toxin-antitoxin system HicB family antitoxin [Lachnospiraceae bacterium]
MSSTMEYKGYIGSVELSEVEGIFYGKVLGIRSLISYEGTNASELIGDFHGAIDDYLAACEEEGIKPEIPYKGSFNVRIGSELHRSAAVYAYNHDISLNSFIEDAVRNRLEMLSAGR